MVESTTYKDSVERGELVPQITLNKLAKPEEEWTLLELEEIASKSLNQYVGDMSHNSVSLFLIYIFVFSLSSKTFSLSMTITIQDYGDLDQRRIQFSLSQLTFHIHKDLTSAL